MVSFERDGGREGVKEGGKEEQIGEGPLLVLAHITRAILFLILLSLYKEINQAAWAGGMAAE
jgi:hypothetical protein